MNNTTTAILVAAIVGVIAGFVFGVLSRFISEAREINRLKTLNEDMDHQIRELLKRDALAPEQMKEIARITKEHSQLCLDQAEIITYLRTRYPSDFRPLGPHKDSTFGQTVLAYLKG